MGETGFPQRNQPKKDYSRCTQKYNRIWMLEGSKPEVQERCDFGALASVYTMSVGFSKISKLISSQGLLLSGV